MSPAHTALLRVFESLNDDDALAVLRDLVRRRKRRKLLWLYYGFVVRDNLPGQPEHVLSDEVYAALMAAVRPNLYADRPTPPPSNVVTHEGKTEVLAQRRAAGVGLWNDHDLRQTAKHRLERLDFLDRLTLSPVQNANGAHAKQNEAGAPRTAEIFVS